MEIELRHLRLVAAVAEAGSISRAAVLLESSQPAVTRQLARLEAAFGGPLFERTARGAVPTELGTKVLARARAVLPVVDSLLTARVPGAHPGHVRHVRVASAIGQTLVALLDALRAVLPDAQVSTDSESGGAALRDLVAAGQLDAAVVHENPGRELELGPSVVRHVLRTEPVFVLMSAGHRLAHRQEVELAELAEDSWVLEPDDGDGTIEHVVEVCARTGFTPQITHQLSWAAADEMIRHEGSISLVYAMSRRIEDMVSVPLVGAPLRYRQLLLVDGRSPFAGRADEVVARTRAELTRIARQHPVLGPWLERHGPLDARRPDGRPHG